MPTQSPTSDFGELLQRVREGSHEAAWDLIEEFAPHVRRVVSRLIDRRIRSQFDSQDFVQAVWASFFRDPARIYSFETPDDAIRYLARMARNKVIDESRRRLGSKKYDVKRLTSLDHGHVHPDQLASPREPTPSAVAVARERWGLLLGKASPQCRDVVRLRFKGATYGEIATQLKLHERSVRKIVDRLMRLQET